MKRIPIFRAGTHTPTSGQSIDFSADTLRAAVAAYDPSLHEAPIVVGHPKDNHPAYGWVKALEYNEATGEVDAIPHQVDASFQEMAQAGRFKKRSASWYLPDAPANPKPGTLYLRHVGFLGAQPPAVKGLRDVSFADSEAGVVEFADSNFVASLVARLMRGVREWIIAEKGVDTADKVAPDYLIGDLETQARAPEPQQTPPSDAASINSFTEEDPMEIEKLTARVAELESENATLKASQMPADFAEREANVSAREAALSDREAAVARQSVEARIDAAVKAGRVLPAQRKQIADFAMTLADGEALIEFGEGEQAKKVSQREAYLLQVEAAPKVVDYSEHSAAGDNPPADAASVDKVVEKAREIVAKSADAGKHVSFTEAVAQATAELSSNA